MEVPAATLRSTLVPLLETGGKIYFLAIHGLLIILGLYYLKTSYHRCLETQFSTVKDTSEERLTPEYKGVPRKMNTQSHAETNELLAPDLNTFCKWLCQRRDGIGSLYTCLWLDRLNLRISEEGMPELKICWFFDDNFPFTFQNFKFWQTFSGDLSFVSMKSMEQDICFTGRFKRHSEKDEFLDLCITLRKYVITVTPCYVYVPYKTPSIKEIEVMPSLISEDEIDVELLHVENSCEHFDMRKMKRTLQTVFNQCLILDSMSIEQLEEPSKFVENFPVKANSITPTDQLSDRDSESDLDTYHDSQEDSSVDLLEEETAGPVNQLKLSSRFEGGTIDAVTMAVPEINILPATPLQDSSNEKFDYTFSSKPSVTSVSMQDVRDREGAKEEKQGSEAKVSSHDDMDVSVVAKRSIPNKTLSRSFNYGSKPRSTAFTRDGSFLALNPSGNTGPSKTSSLIIEAVEEKGTIYYHVPPTMAKKGNIPRKGRKLHVHNDHLFLAKHFKGFPPECTVCSLPLARRLGKQGYQCKDCDAVVHKRCHCLTQEMCPKSTLASLHIEYLGSTNV